MFRQGSPRKRFTTVVLLAAIAVFGSDLQTSAQAQTPTFNALVTTPTNSGSAFPGAAAVGDFNGDGRLDAVVADGSNNLRLMLGNGNGSFSANTVSSVGTNIYTVRAADFDGDGRLDAVVASNQGASTVLINAGNNVSGVPQFTLSNFAGGDRSATVGDLNGDGLTDFILGNQWGGVSVFLNNPGAPGTFSLGHSTAIIGGGGPSVGGGAIADLNGDGHADYVVASAQSAATSVFYGNGTGVLQAPVAISATSFMTVVADLNHDGAPDLLEVNGASLKTYVNGGAGAFGSPTIYSLPGAGSVTAADINGDGHLDALVGNASFDKLQILLGNGTGALGAVNEYAANNNPRDVAVGDFNGDGKPDVAFAGADDRTYGVLLNTTVFVPPAAIFFTDALTGPTSPNLAPIPSGKYAYSGTGLARIQNSTGGGDASSNTDRPVVKTGLATYLNESQFIADVTINLTSPDLAYFGFGQGVPDPNYFQEPSKAFVFRVHSNWQGNSSIQAWPTTFGSTVNNPDHFFGFATGNGNLGTYGGGALQLRIQRNGDSLTLSIPSTGASHTFSISAFAAAMGLNASNSYIFFGNTNTGSVFSDLAIYQVVPDTTAPVITPPADITAEATSAAGAPVSFSATADDDVDGPVSVSANPASGSTFPIATTSVELSSTDAAGNTATASFNVTVQDTTAPVVTAPADIVAEATSASGAAVSFPSAQATDAVGVVSNSSLPASGSTFALGSTTVTSTASDAAGNTGSDTFTVTVVDTTAPSVANVAPSTGTLWPPNHQMVAIALSIVAGDAVGITGYNVTITSSEPDNGLGDGDTANDFQVIGNGTMTPSISLRSERSGKGNGRTYTITVTAVDAAGNVSAAKTTTVSVPKSMGKK